MNKLIGCLILIVGGVASAQPQPTPPTNKVAPAPTTTCFELSADGKLWSKTPERLCVTPTTGTKTEIKLQTGLRPMDVAVFHLDLKTRAKCMDCNKDVFALLNPENSVLNALAITFDGTRDVKARTETGTLTVGATKFFYRRAK